ncbi:MAG TPA: phosphoglycerate mutase family protein [Acidimicrobiales bacterium]|jgi:8-oxo-dGTP diphosphatase|nr:phosphoglycerate mutase family protein [Acidimicrobiales bacterium]
MLLVVRHAQAQSRSEWESDDRDRPLTGRGRMQSDQLADRLLELKPVRILSSPYVRCVDTVRPLADRAAVPVEEEVRLGEGYGAQALGLARSLSQSDDVVVLCSHGDVIPELLAAAANEDRVDLGPAPQVEKASVWVLHGTGRFTSAEYIKPPKGR